MFRNGLGPSQELWFFSDFWLTQPPEVDFGLFWKFHYLLNRARKPLKRAGGVLSQLLDALLLIPHSTIFGPSDYRTIGLSDYRTIWLSDYRTIVFFCFFLRITPCLGLKRSAQRMLRESNSGWSLSCTQLWESKCPKLGKVPFLKSEGVKMVRKSKFSKRFQTIPRHDWTWKDQCLAISDLFHYSHNFNYCSSKFIFWAP